MTPEQVVEFTVTQLEDWYEQSEREQAGEKLLDLQILTAAVAMGLDPKKGGKFVTALEQNLLAIATGKKPKAVDPAAVAREHVKLLRQMGATVRGN